jgi:hypothetical protein
VPVVTLAGRVIMVLLLCGGRDGAYPAEPDYLKHQPSFVSSINMHMHLLFHPAGTFLENFEFY